MSVVDEPLEASAEFDGPVIKTRRLKEDTEMDITPMIDCVFLLLIFFTVTSTPDAQTALSLAESKNGVDVSAQNSAMISLAFKDAGLPAEVYLADGKLGAPLVGDLIEQERQIRDYVERYMVGGNQTVIIKSEKDVRYRDTSRVAAAAGSVEGAEIFLGVLAHD